ncbi:MAG: transglycosylase domain-containing protein, partial [Planctomycetota bacterium]|nr:transglycosylase domain-containing protein [Planctomycetota bacterium]
MNATDRRDSVVGALRCALRFGGLTDAVAYAARLDGLASRAVKVAELADDELRPLAEDALKYLDPRPRPKAFERLRALCGDEGIEVRVLNAHAEVSVPQRLRWDLGRLLTASANDRSRDPLLRRAAAFARRALVLCDQGDPLEPGTSNLVRAVRAAPLQVEDVGLDPVRIEVMPAHDLVDELDRLHYREVTELTRPGTWRRRRGRFEIAVRAVRFADEQRPAQVVAVTIEGGAIASLRDARNADIPVFRLDPQLIGSIFPIHGEDRIVLTPDEVPPLLPAAIKAVEDRRFDTHHGVDAEAIARAMWVNLRAGRVEQG